MGDSEELSEILLNVRAHAGDEPAGRIVAVEFVTPESDALAEADRLADRAGALLARSITSDSDGLAGRLRSLNEDIEAARDNGVLVVVELPDGARFGHLFDEPRALDDDFYRLCRAIGVDDDPLEADIVGSRVPVERRGGQWRIAVGKASA